MSLIARLSNERDIIPQLDRILNRLDVDLGTSTKTFHTFGEAQTIPEIVSEIISRVKSKGDAAVSQCLKLIDRVEVSTDRLKVSPDEFSQARSQISEDLENSLQLMAQRIESYAKAMMPKTEVWFAEEEGRQLGYRFTAIESLGAYVPGGLGASTPLISTVLMNLIPAKVAGVKHMVVATPCGEKGAIHPALLRACELAGVTHVYRAGGAQGIAAMALGTESCPACHKIIGPGNAFVQEAKRQLYGTIDIDMMAGPSEIAIIADQGADPAVLAADLIAQAEHDPMASSVLFTNYEPHLERVHAELELQLQDLPKSEIARQSLSEFGALCYVENLEKACQLSDHLAPEHLELAVAEPKELIPKLQHAGAVFCGYQTPEVAGDYTAGPSHTLPTCGAARFASGITVYSFLKSSSLLSYTKPAMQGDLAALTAMAREENLEGHARSAESRFKV